MTKRFSNKSQMSVDAYDSAEAKTPECVRIKAHLDAMYVSDAVSTRVSHSTAMRKKFTETVLEIDLCKSTFCCSFLMTELC